MCKQAEGIGVALESGPAIRIRSASRADAVRFLPRICAYGTLARVAERRVAQVVCQTGDGHDGAYFRQMAVVQFQMQGKQLFG